MAKKEKRPEPYLRCGSTCKEEYEQVSGPEGRCKKTPLTDTEKKVRVYWGSICQYLIPNPALEERAQSSS